MEQEFIFNCFNTTAVVVDWKQELFFGNHMSVRLGSFTVFTVYSSINLYYQTDKASLGLTVYVFIRFGWDFIAMTICRDV